MQRAEAPENVRVGGWQETIKTAADINNGIWYPDLGWVITKTNILPNEFEHDPFKLDNEETRVGAWDEPSPFDATRATAATPRIPVPFD